MRRGIALALIRDAEAIARSQGVERIEVTANHHALAFYERAGFVEIGPAQTRFGPAIRMHLDVPRAPDFTLFTPTSPANAPERGRPRRPSAAERPVHGPHELLAAGIAFGSKRRSFIT